MASSRKKQDEKNLKTLRELGSLPHNKYCFDCNQRGPTYVNITVGSFVCTKCSGMLRGLTPPHRVKSISMATFSVDEIETLKSRGNDYCKKVWLGLYEGTPLIDARDEQSIRDLMVNKYERKRYYLDPSQVVVVKNGYGKSEPFKNNSSNNAVVVPESRPLKTLISDPKPVRINGVAATSTDNQRKRPECNRSNLVIENNVKNTTDFVANFDSADIFSSPTTNCSNNNNNSNASAQNGFANFDNNPIFNSSNGMPSPSTLTNMNSPQQQQLHNLTVNKGSAAQSEDRYAALKDLDNAFKTQSQSALDWASSGSNGSLYSSSTPTGSAYSSPSPQNSMFGSPPQGQFLAMFQGVQYEGNGVSNPFNNSNTAWPSTNGSNGIVGGVQGQQQQQQQQQPFANPFRSNETKANGYTQSFQNTPIFPVASNGSAWPGNPFKVGSAAPVANSNNPFL